MAGPISKLRKAIKTFREFDPEMEYLNGAVSHYDLERRQREIVKEHGFELVDHNLVLYVRKPQK